MTKIEILQIKWCKPEQYDDNDTIGISPISTFRFVLVFSVFGFFSFEIVSLSTIWYHLAFYFPVLFSSWQTLDAYNNRIVSLRGMLNYIILF